MKKATLAAITATALLIPACAAESGDRVLRVLVGANAKYAAQQRQWFDEIGAEFRARTGARVRFETFASAADEQRIIQLSAVSGQGPDVYGVGSTFVPVMHATGNFVPLTEQRWQTVGGRTRYPVAMLGLSGPSAADQIAVPVASRPFVLAYNTEMFAAAGIKTSPKTWDEFTNYGRRLTKDGVFGAAIAYADNFDPWKYIWAMSLQYGTPLVSDGSSRLDDANVRRSFQEYFGLMTEHRITPPESVGWTNPQALAAFADGKVAMMPMTSPTSLPTLTEAAVAGKWAYAPMPTIPPGHDTLPQAGRPAASIISGDYMAVAEYSDHQDLAFEFIALITSETQQLRRFELFGDFPVNQRAAVTVAERHAELAPVLVAGKLSIPTPFTGAWSEIQLALSNIAVQARPELEAGKVDPGRLTRRLEEADAAAQQALDREADAR